MFIPPDYNPGRIAAHTKIEMVVSMLHLILQDHDAGDSFSDTEAVRLDQLTQSLELFADRIAPK